MISITSTLRVQKPGSKIREKMLERIKAEENKIERNVCEADRLSATELDLLRSTYQGMDNDNIYVLTPDQCFELGF